MPRQEFKIIINSDNYILGDGLYYTRESDNIIEFWDMFYYTAKHYRTIDQQLGEPEENMQSTLQELEDSDQYWLNQ